MFRNRAQNGVRVQITISPLFAFFRLKKVQAELHLESNSDPLFLGSICQRKSDSTLRSLAPYVDPCRVHFVTRG